MKDSEKSNLTGIHIWLVLLKAFHSIAAHVTPELRKSGLGDSDFRVLEVLLHKGALPVNTIGAKVFLTPGSISTAVDRLYGRGLVTRADSEADRRVRVVDLTPKGRKLIAAVFQKHVEHLEALTGVLTDLERIQLLHALKKIGKLAEGRKAGAAPRGHADTSPTGSAMPPKSVID